MGVRLRYKSKNKKGLAQYLLGNCVTREERQLQMARMLIRGIPQHEIAKAYGFTTKTVSVEIKNIRKEWKNERLGTYDEFKDQKLAELRETKQVAWLAWEESKGGEATSRKVTEKARRASPEQKDKRGKVVKAAVDEMVITKEKVDKARRSQVGDPRYLDIVMRCIAEEAKWLGLNDEDRAKETTTVTVNFNELFVNVPDVVPDAAEERIARVALPVSVSNKE